MTPCSFYTDDHVAVRRVACSAHGDRHPAACANELWEELRQAHLQIEALRKVLSSGYQQGMNGLVLDRNAVFRVLYPNAAKVDDKKQERGEKPKS